MRRAALAVAVAGAAAAAGALVWALSAGGDDAERPGSGHAPAVVQVVVPHGVGPGDVAAGFALGDERVVTVAHVLAGRGGAAVTVRRADGRRLAGTVLATDERDDLAVVGVPGLRAPAARTTSGGGPFVLLLRRDGRTVAVPAPVRRAITARVRELSGAVRARPALELATEVRAGDSGAPVVTVDGQVAGVLFARSRNRAETAYAVGGPAVERLARATR